jgi:hypothetical protein
LAEATRIWMGFELISRSYLDDRISPPLPHAKQKKKYIKKFA